MLFSNREMHRGFRGTDAGQRPDNKSLFLGFFFVICSDAPERSLYCRGCRTGYTVVSAKKETLIMHFMVVRLHHTQDSSSTAIRC